MELKNIIYYSRDTTSAIKHLGSFSFLFPVCMAHPQIFNSTLHSVNRTSNVLELNQSDAELTMSYRRSITAPRCIKNQRWTKLIWEIPFFVTCIR